MVTPLLTVFFQGLSRSAAAAKELRRQGFAGVVVSDWGHLEAMLPANAVGL